MPKETDDLPDVTISKLLFGLLIHSWIIVIVVALAIGLGLRTLKNSTPEYLAEVPIRAADAGLSPQASGTQNALTTILNVAPARAPGLDVFFATLESYRLAQRLEEKFGLLRVINEGRWDEENQTWKPAGPRRWDGIRRWIGMPTEVPPPSIIDLRSFLGNLEVVEDLDNTTTTTVQFFHPDPEFARNFLALVVAEADAMIREADVRKAEKTQDFIRETLAEITEINTRQVLLNILEREYQKSILASTGQSYNVELFDPVTVSPLPVRPNIERTLVLHGVLGFGFGVILAMLFFFRKTAFGVRAKAVTNYTS